MEIDLYFFSQKILFQKDDEIRELENMIRNNQSVSGCTEGQKCMSGTTTNEGGFYENKPLNEDTQKLKKQTRLTQIECDGMKKLVETLNDRVDSLLQENADLKYVSWKFCVTTIRSIFVIFCETFELV